MHHPLSIGRIPVGRAARWVALALVAGGAAPSLAGDREPPRKELWVPTRHLDEVLLQHPNAVLLDRAQYEALVRDAGKVKAGGDVSKPPVDAVVEGVKLQAELAGGAQHITIRAVLTVHALGDRWAEVPLLKLPADVVMTKFDGSGVSVKSGGPDKNVAPAVLAVRGKGRHQVTMEFQSPLHRANRICRATVPYLARPCAITATALGTARVPDGWLLRDGVATIPHVVPVGDATGTVLTWTEAPAEGAATDGAVRQDSDSLTSVDANGVTSSVRMRLRSANGPLPKMLKFTLAAADAHVLSVDSSGVASWRQDGKVLEIVRAGGFADAAVFRCTILRPAPEGEGTSPVVLEIPRLEGAVLVAASVGLSAVDDFEMTGWKDAGAAPDEAFRAYERSVKSKPEETFLVRYEVAPEPLIANIRRRGHHFSADIDNRIVLSSHDVALERGLAFRGEEGRVNRATFALPPGEQFLGLDPISGERVEWKQVEDAREGAAPAFEIRWSGGLRKGQASTLRLRTRRDLEAGTLDGKGTEKLAFENLRMTGAIRVAGYVALEFDESWKVSPLETTGLESRDARVTPVKGRMAWFTLRDHRLALEIARNDPEVDGGIVAYALPRAKNIEIEGQVALEVSRAPLRKLDVKLPVASAALLRWDSPLIGEQSLDAASGTWHLTLRKELAGAANLRFHLSLPAERNPAAGAAPAATTLAATLPEFAIPAARRFTGAWVVEANTDTELAFEARGLQPLDASHPPAVEGYAPRHRILAAYAYGAGARELKLTATRHEPGSLVGAVVNELRLLSVLGRDGVDRHEAALLVKHNGQQFFGVGLPKGAVVLGARSGGQPVKPVRAGEDEVRLALPANQSVDAPVWVVVAYELRGNVWNPNGVARLLPPSVGEGIPVLNSSWRVHVPDGYSFGEPGTTLEHEVRDWAGDTLLARATDLLADKCAALPLGMIPRKSASGAALARSGEMETLQLEYPKPIFQGAPVPLTMEPQSVANTVNVSRYYQEKAGKIMLPSVQFRGARIDEALEFLRVKGRDLDTLERNPGNRGIPIVLQSGPSPSTAQITLDLKDVPLLEALRYITELAGMKFRFESQGIVVAPVTDVAAEQVARTFKLSPNSPLAASARNPGSALEALKAAGVPFPEGASATFTGDGSTLVVKNTGPNLDLAETVIAGGARGAGRLAARDEVWKELKDSAVSRKSGLISLELEVPAAGRAFEFHGAQRPGIITLRYVSWERQMLTATGWFLLGLGLALAAGRRRPWFRAFAAALLLTCLPLILAPSWLVSCNALLAGWLSVFAFGVFRRLAQWVEEKWARLAASSGGRSLPSTLALAIAILIVGGAGGVRAEDKPDPAAHTVIVPYDLSLPRDPARANRYYLDYADFQKLWELAKENRRPALPDAPEASGKPEAFLGAALYDARAEDDKLTIQARLEVWSRGAKWAKLPLPFRGDGVAVAEVKLDGVTALFEKGEVFIENPGQHTLEVSLHVLRDRGWKEATVDVPAAVSSMLTLSVPGSDGRPVFGAGAAGVLAVEEARGDRRSFTLPLGAARSIAISRTPGRRLVADAPPAQSDSRVTLQVLPRMEKVSGEVRFGFPGTERRSLTVELDVSLRLESVIAEPAAEAILRKTGSRQFVDFHFARTVADGAVIKITGTRAFGADAGSRTTPVLAGVSVRAGGAIEFRSTDEWRVQVDASAAGRLSAGSGEGGAGTYRLPEGAPLRYAVAAAEDRSRARFEAVHQFTAQKAEIIAAITLDSGRAPLAGARIGVPQGYEVQSLAGPRIKSWHREGDFAEVQFDTLPEREAKIVLHAARTLPRPADSWKIEPVLLPQFAKQSGVVLVAVHAADEVKLTLNGAERSAREADPATLTSLVRIAPPFQAKRALIVEQSGWGAVASLTRQAPRFSIDAVLLARATDLGLGLSQQIGLAVEQGAVGGVKVRLPKSLPEARVHGATVRDTQSRINGESREYDISFQTEALDRVDFTMDYELSLEGEKNLPSVQVDGADRIRRFVIVDNSGAREMKLDAGGAETASREVLPYLPDGLVRPQFLRAGDKAAVKLSFTQLESTAGNAAIITLAEITTALRASGERWETVAYSLANRSLQFLPVRLPEGAELVEVSVGGQAVRADVGNGPAAERGKVYLVPLIQMRPGELSQQVKLVYRFPGAGGIAEVHRFREPELVGLSAERTLWNVWVPERFRAKKFDGNMEEIGGQGSELEKLQSDLSDIARLNRIISSGKLNREEAAYAWDNANYKIAEVRKQQAYNRSRSRSAPAEAEDESRREKLGKVVSQLDADVDRQIQEQGTLILGNAVVVEKAKQQADASGAPSGPGQQAFRRSGANTGGAAANWGFNKGAAAQGGKSEGASLDLNGTVGLIDLNDNVSVDGAGFFKTTTGPLAGTISGSGGTLTKAGAGTLVLNASSTNLLSGNARAGQKAQAEQQVTINGGTLRFGDATSSLGDRSASSLGLGNVAAGGESAVSAYAGQMSGTIGTPVPGKKNDTLVANSTAFSGGVTVTAGTTVTVQPRSEMGRDKALEAMTSFGSNAPSAPADPFATPAAAAPKPATPTPASAPAPAKPAAKEAAAPAARTDVLAMRSLAVPEAKKKAGGGFQDDADGLAKHEPAAPPATPQLKTVGRVSLAVEVPLSGTVHHFSKLKDHASLEVTVARPFEDRQSGALWVLGAGLVILFAAEAFRRWRARRAARVRVTACAVA